MFEQFKENIRLTRQTYRAAAEGYKSGREAFKQAAPEKKAVVILVAGAIVINAFAEHFSIAWYYTLTMVLVVVPLMVWLKWKARAGSLL